MRRHRALPMLLPLALLTAGCVHGDPYYDSYNAYEAERVARWQQEEAARRAEAEARRRQWEAERDARWREEMERRRAWAAEQREWDRARREEFSGAYPPGGEATREEAPPYQQQPYGYAPSPYQGAAPYASSPYPSSPYQAPGGQPYAYQAAPYQSYGGQADPYATPAPGTVSPPQRWY